MFLNGNEMIVIRIKGVMVLGGRYLMDKVEFYKDMLVIVNVLIIILSFRFIDIYCRILNK